jgi:hypothetical protein
MAHEEAAFSRKHSAVSENQNQNQRPFTTEDTESTEKGQTTTQQRAEALALKLAQTYEELTRLLERNPGVKRQITEGESREDKVYQKLKQRLKLADMAPRCQWVRQGGTACRSPQMKRHIYCFAHRQMMEARELMLRLPAPEDANAIQIGIMRIQKSLIEDTISTKKAGLLLYSMQLALTNVGQTTFGQAKDEEMVRDTVDEEEAIREEARSSRYSVFSERQNQNLFTAKDAEDAKEEKGLPRMNADDRGLQGEESSGEREFVHAPGGDGFHRVRLGIEPSLTGERKPPQGIAQPGMAVPHEHAQLYFSSLRDERLPKGPRSASEPLGADTGAGSVLQIEPYAILG